MGPLCDQSRQGGIDCPALKWNNMSKKSFGLSGEDTQDKDDWRLRMKEEPATQVKVEISIKMVCVCLHRI